MGKHTNKPRIINLNKAMKMSGYDDVTRVKITPRDGFDEIRIDSQKAYAAALADASIILNTIRFAEPKVVGAYAKAIIGGVKVKKGANAARRFGVIAHVPK